MPPPHVTGQSPLELQLESITKTFGSTCALDGATLSVRPGTVHALLGENGAGKTTLMRIAYGMIKPDAGTIQLDGQIQRFVSPADAIDQGIGMVHQHFMLVPAMTVAENVALGKTGRYTASRAQSEVRRVSEQSGLPVDPKAVVKTLPIVAQQRVEILKALARSARILILDEPTAVLAPAEARELLQRMRQFAHSGGTVILITHKLKDALAFADDITVLRRGKTVLENQAVYLNERLLAEAMIGTQPPPTRTPSPQSHTSSSTTQWENAQPVFRLDQVSLYDQHHVARLKQVSLSIYAGEILGVAGVEGNGQYELLRVLAGRMNFSRGQRFIPQTIGFVPEDRQRDAVILDFPLYENVALSHAGQKRGWMPWTSLKERTAALIKQHDVRAIGVTMTMRGLSGGNQQKFVVGRELESAPYALVVENPTRGLDIQATTMVHQRLRDARQQGAAIVVYSSDLDEILALADRMVVVYAGEVHEVPTDRVMIGQAMLRANPTTS